MSDLITQTTSKKVLDATLEVLKASSPVIAALTDLVLDSAKKTDELQESGELSALNDEARKQAISLQMAKMQATVAQELAIAERIKNAEEVEIEEYYEGEKSAGINATANQEGGSISLGGSGRQVTKRVYRFKSSVTKT